MKRPILIITLGIIVGIIVGLYFNIVLFILFILLLYLLQYIILTKYKRFIQIFINKQILILFFIAFLIGNRYILYLEREYEKIYESLDKVNGIGTLISEKEEKEYNNIYKIRVEKINGKKINNKDFLLSIKRDECKNNIKYGDKIYFEGEYIVPEKQRNYQGFNYRQYLKTLKIYGTIKVNNNLRIIQQNQINLISNVSNQLKNRIIENSNILFLSETKGIFLGILLGYTDFISDDDRERFSDSSLSHLLAVSGAHVSYIILGLTLFMKLIKTPKNLSKIFACIFLLFYLYIINFTPSVTRAVIMSIIVALQSVVHRKQDTITTISLSVLLIVAENPYKIFNIGFLLSYFGTIGIILFVQKPSKKETNSEDIKRKIINYLKNMSIVTISAQILIFPIMIYYFNTISLTFIISNLIAGVLMGPITIIGLLIIILSFFSLFFTSIIVKFYNILLITLLNTTKVISNIPISKIYVKTPDIIWVILYYFIIILGYIIFIIKNSHRIFLKNKIKLIIKKIKEIIKTNKIKILVILFGILILYFILYVTPKDLRIYFIDVGQGDSCLIITPKNKTILIDSGGSENYDVGKNTLLPYLLDRGVTSLDYILISHFDTDHCKGFEYILENIKVKNIIISKQIEITENFKTIYAIAKRKNINIMVVSRGDIIQLDKYSKLEIFTPKENFKLQDINDNSIIAKFTSYNFSVLFTGDASQNVEHELLKDKSINLESTVLKVSHHGSKSGTSEEFLREVKPKIALIGVGKNNKFGHPNQEVVEKLKNRNIQIYRTDEMGEIMIVVSKKGRIKIESIINDKK